MTLFAIRVTGNFCWGFSIRIPGTSAGGDTYLVPPPSTLIGAFVKGISSVLNLPECCTMSSRRRISIGSIVAKFLKCFKLSAFKFNPSSEVRPIKYADMIRVLRGPYLRKTYAESITRRFGVSTIGRIYYPHGGFSIIYIIDDDALKEVLRDFKVTEDPLKIIIRAAFSIVSIGSKESIVSISDVKIGSVKCVSNSEVTTSYYFPSDAVERINPPDSWTIVEFYSIKDSIFKFHGVQKAVSTELIKYVVPVKSHGLLEPTEVACVLKSNAVCYECNFDGEIEYVIGVK